MHTIKRTLIKYTGLLLILLSCLCPTSAAAAKKNNFKVICWNVLYGFNHRRSIKEGVAWINKQKPNVLALQELNGHSQESLSKMAKEWGHDHAVILKENGFPVGLTSKQPIEVIERRLKDFHHGYLHCKTYGIHYFVVHFWPHRVNESKFIMEKVDPLLKQGEKVIILGDFNTFSKKDEKYLATKKDKKPLYFDVDLFESKGFVDLVFKHDPKAKYSSPSPITIPRWSKDMAEIISKRARIDFIFADQTLQKHSISGKIILSKEVEKISDHYPVIVEFKKSALYNKKR